MNTIHGVKQYWRSTLFFSASAVFLTAVAVGTDGNAQDGAPPFQRPTPTPTQTPTLTPTLKPTPSASALPTAPPVTLPPVTLPPVTLPPSTVLTTPTVIVLPTPPGPTPTPTPTPTAVPTPRNKAKGLKDGCLVQKKKWLLRVPCPPAHRNEG